MADLEAINAKIIRAEQHFGTLAEEVLTYLKTCKHSFTPKINAQRAEARIFYTVSPDPPIRLSILVGDVVYNVRSALDQLICAILRTTKADHGCSGRAFPMCADPNEYAGQRQTMLKGLPKDAKTIIDGLQPCARLDGTATIHPLTILSKLSNKDKHRLPILTVTRGRNVFVRFHSGKRAIEQPVTVRLDNGTHIHWTGLPDWVKPGVQVTVGGTDTVSFNEEGDWGDRTFDETLDPVIQFAKRFVIPRLKPFVH